MQAFFKWSILLFTTICNVNFSQAQMPLKPSSGDIYNKIKSLQKVGTVMYLAAHPDDENTRLITWLSNKQHLNTVYLSLTRGDGGQNLIGTETGDLLGILRTQELLMARRVDGGKQWFTRANDFGYSKKASETLHIWDKNEVLSDVVAAIRYWQPDIIINRFPSDTTVQTHGHHTASAILGLEAFDLANDARAFPDSYKKYGAWQPARIYFNTSYFFYKSQEEFDKADKSALANIEIGDYYPITGRSNNEIAAESRSMHKCQAFGTSGSRTEQKEYLEYLKGKKTGNKDDIFEGLDLSWNRLKGGKPVNAMIENILNNYKFENPSLSIPDLVKLYQFINKNVENSRRKDQKLEDLKEIIASAAGLFLEAAAVSAITTRSADVKIKTEITNRSPLQLRLNKISILPNVWDTILLEKLLPPGGNMMLESNLITPSGINFTGPYWVADKPNNGLYVVNNPDLRGVPETPRELKVVFSVNINGQDFEFGRNVIYKFTDPAKGEVYTPFDVMPDVYLNPVEDVVLFPDNKAKNIQVKLTAAKDNMEGTVSVTTTNGWRCSNNNQKLIIKKKGDEQVFSFTISPPSAKSETDINFIATVKGQEFRNSMVEVAYDHIPTQRVLKPSYSRLVHDDIKCSPVKIAYLTGAGDKIPEALKQLGIDVHFIKAEEIELEKISNYDVILTGVRAYNTLQMLANKHEIMMKFVENGGTLICQYNTAFGLVTKDIGPYPFTISRGRVTDENAPMQMLDKDHRIFNMPNKLTNADFEAWVQERGLYFITTDDTRYQKLLKTHDPGEQDLDGSLVTCKYGKGNFVYCSLSLFRQLPAGVPGAYKLLANMLSLGVQQN